MKPKWNIITMKCSNYEAHDTNPVKNAAQKLIESITRAQSVKPDPTTNRNIWSSVAVINFHI